MDSRRHLYILIVILLIKNTVGSSHAPVPHKSNWLIFPQTDTPIRFSNEANQAATLNPSGLAATNQDSINNDKSRLIEQVQLLAESSIPRGLLQLYPTVSDILAEASTDEGLSTDLLNYIRNIGRAPLNDKLFARETQKLLQEYDPTMNNFYDLCNPASIGSLGDHVERFIQNNPFEWDGYDKAPGSLMKYKLGLGKLKKASLKSLLFSWRRKMLRYFAIYQMTRTLTIVRKRSNLKSLNALLQFFLRLMSQLSLIRRPVKSPRTY